MKTKKETEEGKVTGALEDGEGGKGGKEDCKRYTKLCESIERTSQKDTH